MEVEDERERKEKRKEGGHLLLCSPFIPFQENVVLQTFTCTVKATVPCTCSTTFTELWGERFKKDQYNIALCHRKLCMQMKTMSLAHDSCHFLAMVHITLIKRTERMKSSPIPRGGASDFSWLTDPINSSNLPNTSIPHPTSSRCPHYKFEKYWKSSCLGPF